MNQTLNVILIDSGFSDAHIAALEGEGYTDLDGFSGLTQTDLLTLVNGVVASASGSTFLKAGQAASAIAKVKRTLASSTSETKAGHPLAGGGQGPIQIMSVDKYDGSLAALIELLNVDPTDDKARELITALTTDKGTGQERVTFIRVDGKVDGSLSAELNTILTNTRKVSLKDGMFKGHKAVTLSKALRVRYLADPRDKSVMLTEYTDGAGVKHLVSGLDGADFLAARSNLHLLSFARLYMPSSWEKLKDVDGYTLAEELAKTPLPPRFAAVIAEIQEAELDAPAKVAQAKQELVMALGDDEVVGSGGATFPDVAKSWR